MNGERRALTGDEQDAVVAKARKLIPVIKADPDALVRRSEEDAPDKSRDTVSRNPAKP